MQNNLIINTNEVFWSRSIRFGKMQIRFGRHSTREVSSFFVEKNVRKDDHIVIRQQIFQKIKFGKKIRLAHHTRTQILKKNKGWETKE